jgi:ArsR family metal-binding transcriptional regulator
MEKLITEYQTELSESGCSPGSGRYGARVATPVDISASFPYLNAVLGNTVYDRENGILLGEDHGRRYAFRPDDIRIAGLSEAAEAPEAAREAVDLVNAIWERRDEITPSFRERKVPATVELYQFLPKTNCGQCSRPTCLAFAADLRDDPELLNLCPPLMQPEHAADRAQIGRLFAGD